MVVTGAGLALIGLALTAVNVVGLARGLALYPVTREFGEGERSLARTRPIGRLAELRRRPDESDDTYAARLTRAINGHLVHSMGSPFPRVSALQNWILWLLGTVAPSRFRNLEFRNARFALERGFGLCSQAALVLADLLGRAGIRAEIAVLEGHVVVTAETAPGRWIVLDPDYGVTIPMTLDEVRSQADVVVARSYGGDCGASVVARLVPAYANGYRLAPRGGRERLRASFERLTFFLKWALPLLMIGVGGLLYAGR
jgi:hypothetical protein